MRDSASWISVSHVPSHLLLLVLLIFSFFVVSATILLGRGHRWGCGGGCGGGGNDTAGLRSVEVISSINGHRAAEDGVFARKVSENIGAAIKSVPTSCAGGEVGDSASLGILELVLDSVGINLLQRVKFSAGAAAACSKRSEGVDPEDILLASA